MHQVSRPRPGNLQAMMPRQTPTHLSSSIQHGLHHNTTSLTCWPPPHCHITLNCCNTQPETQSIPSCYYNCNTFLPNIETLSLVSTKARSTFDPDTASHLRSSSVPTLAASATLAERENHDCGTALLRISTSHQHTAIKLVMSLLHSQALLSCYRYSNHGTSHHSRPHHETALENIPSPYHYHEDFSLNFRRKFCAAYTMQTVSKAVGIPSTTIQQFASEAYHNPENSRKTDPPSPINDHENPVRKEPFPERISHYPYHHPRNIRKMIPHSGKLAIEGTPSCASTSSSYYERLDHKNPDFLKVILLVQIND